MDDRERLYWEKSTLSSTGQCVEWAVSQEDKVVFVRNSKYPDGDRLKFNQYEWEAFVFAVKNGEADPFWGR